MFEKRRSLYVFILLVTFTLSAATFAGSPPRKIIVFADDVVNSAAQAALAKNFGAENIKHLNLINGMAVYLPPQAEKALANRAEVLRIDDDIKIMATVKPAERPEKSKKDPPPQPEQETPWGITAIGADLAWPITVGTNIKVAVIDTGIDLSHPDLIGNIAGDINVIRPNKSGNDDNGHGTHVAGTIGALNNEIGVVGGAPSVSLYAVKALDRKGGGWLSDLIEGLEWCIDEGIDVINLSLGAVADNLSFHEAIISAYNEGIVIVAAAGNNGEYGGAIDYPAMYPETIAVSAIGSNYDIAYFSSYGPEVDLAAPGVNIFSTVRGGSYGTYNGTSMATPHVVAAAALVLATPVGAYDADLDDAWGPDEVMLKLYDTASDIYLADDYQGWGLVNAAAAVE